MDPCVLANTGLNLHIFLAVAILLLLSALFITSNLTKSKIIYGFFALIFIFGAMITPQSLYAQNAINECLPESSETEDPTEESPQDLNLIDDVFSVPADGFYPINILFNDMPPISDPIDWETVDIDLATAGIQTSVDATPPGEPGTICGEFTFDSTFGILLLDLYSICFDEEVNTVPLPEQVTLQYNAQTEGSIEANNPATVTVNIDPLTPQEEVSAVTDRWCSNSTTFNILTNDTTSSGALNPITIDLDPMTPGRQTIVERSNVSGSITLEVDTDGIVTFTNNNFFDSQNFANFYYTVENDNGNISNIAVIRPDQNVCE